MIVRDWDNIMIGKILLAFESTVYSDKIKLNA